MLRMPKWFAPVAGLALVLGLGQGQSRAADPAPATDAKASITVTVVDADGKAVPGVTVALTAAPVKKAKGETADPTTAPTGAPATKVKAKILATGVTDADGKAVLPSIADGKYRATAHLKGSGTGHEIVTVSDGKDVTVSITLKVKAKAT